MSATEAAFQQWIDAFEEWQGTLDYPTELLGDFNFETKYGTTRSDDIEFGQYAGQPKWETTADMPDGIADALFKLITVQGDTEFASVEQQRHLLDDAPSEYDLKSMLRVNAEEMRHGWQMCALLIDHFGERGVKAAMEELERDAREGERILGSFNEPVEDWLDFFTFAQFIDRDGKYQLKMLSFSGFAPLARSMGPMLKEEAFHLGTGYTGLRRVIDQNVVPIEIVQRYLNKWVPTAYDLFGKDHHQGAANFWTWGLKGRFDEDQAEGEPDLDLINDHSRQLYHQEISDQVGRLNDRLDSNEPELTLPSLKFNRQIGQYAGKYYDIHGNPVEKERWDAYLTSVLPTPEDRKTMDRIMANEQWIATRGGA